MAVAAHKERALDTTFAGTTYDTILWQAACHYRAQQIGPKSRDLMALTGAKVSAFPTPAPPDSADIDCVVVVGG